MLPTKKQLVQLSFATKITQDGEVENFQFETAGELLVKNGQIFLRYTEILAEQQTQVRFKFESNAVRLSRTGVGQTKLVFIPETKVPAFYQTPAGQMHLETYTTDLSVQIDDKEGHGQIEINYQLIANDQVVGEYELRLQFQAKSSKLN